MGPLTQIHIATSTGWRLASAAVGLLSIEELNQGCVQEVSVDYCAPPIIMINKAEHTNENGAKASKGYANLIYLLLLYSDIDIVRANICAVGS